MRKNTISVWFSSMFIILMYIMCYQLWWKSCNWENLTKAKAWKFSGIHLKNHTSCCHLWTNLRINFFSRFALSSSFLFQLGRTKVFLRAGQIGILDSRRAEVLDNAAKCIQRRLRTFIARRDFDSTRAAAFSIQAYCRG